MMMPKTYFENEIILFDSKNGKQHIIITNVRCRFSNSLSDNKTYTSILNKDISYVSIHSKKYNWLIIIGMVLGMLSFYLFSESNLEKIAPYGLFISGFFVLGYFLTKIQLLTISTAGGKIDFKMKNQSISEIKDLLDLLDKVRPSIKS